MSRLTTDNVRSRRLAVEALEHRTLLAADVVAEVAASLYLEPLPGDANQDGYFDQTDLIQVLQGGKYLTGERADWKEGDWNRDGTFDQLDLVSALQVGAYSDTTVGGVGSHAYLAKAHGRSELPHRLWGDTTIVLDFSSAFPDAGLLVVPVSISGSGIATQTGRFEVAGTGTVKFDVSSGTPIPVLTEGNGCSTVKATGDQICWVAQEVGTSQHVSITYTQGTGRFEDVEGGFTYNYTPDPGNPPDLMTYHFVGMGTITF